MIILGTNSIKDTGYDVANSLRFDGSGDYMYRTMGTATNRKKFTISAWVKRCEISDNHYILDVPTGSNHDSSFRFHQNNFFGLGQWEGTDVTQINTQALFRDVSAWYHAVASVDTTQTTDSNRVKIYINGVQQTLSSPSYPSQNFEYYINGSYRHNIGYKQPDNARYLDGYLAEMVFIDGQQLTPTSFGEFDEDSGIWKPIDVSGLTFGNNGFYLDFEDSSALGNDVSGNNNDFTVNNLTAIDQSTDTCTNNFATWNPLQYGTFTAGSTTMADGNLTFTSNETGSNYPIRYSTIAVSSGKWYAEFKVVSSATGFTIGISDGVPNPYIANTNDNEVGYYYDGRRFGFSTTTHSPWGNSFTTNDIIGVAMDLDNNKLYFSKNGTYQESGNPTNGTNGITIPTSETGVYHFAFGDRNNTGQPGVSANFGSPAYSISSGNTDGNGYGNFEYAVPSGYYSLNSKNLAEYG